MLGRPAQVSTQEREATDRGDLNSPHAPSMRLTASSASLASSNSMNAKPGGLRATQMLRIWP